MKKVIFTVATVLIGSAAMSQGLYGSFNVGYGFATPGEVLGTETDVTSSGTTETNVYGTYGAGLNLGLTPGYMITENFGVELGLNYFMGSEVQATRITTGAGELTAKVHSNQFRILPALVISTGTGAGLHAYGKAGLVFPVTGTTFTTVENTGYMGPGTGFTREYETKGAFSIGYSGTIGVNYGLSDNLSLFGELSGFHLRINAKSREVTKATNNGTDVMGVLTTYDKNINYVDELNSSSNNAGYNPNYTEDQAEEDLRTRNNFGALFINIGVKWSF